MADQLRWTPNEFYTIKFDASQRSLRKTAGGTLAVSAGRTWTTCAVQTGEYLGQRWRAYRFNIGPSASPLNFVVVHPDGGIVVSNSANTPAVNPTVITATIG